MLSCTHSALRVRRLLPYWWLPHLPTTVVVVVVFTLTRIIKSVVTGQAPVTLEMRNTPGKNTYNPRWYTHISQLTHSCLLQKYIKVKSGVSLRCARSRPVHTSHYSRLEKPNIPIATQGRLPGIFFFFFFFLAHFHFPSSGQAVVTGVIPSPPRFLPSIFIAHRVQQSHCSSIVHRMLLTHTLALSASQFVHKKSPNEFIRVCTRRGSNSRN